MTGLTKGMAGIDDIFKRLFKWRIGSAWWLVAPSPLAGYFVIVIVLRVIQGNWVDLNLLGEVNFLPNLGFGALFLWIFTYGIGEEIGWCGYALPKLQEKNERFIRNSCAGCVMGIMAFANLLLLV